jgi:hypothetical protein
MTKTTVASDYDHQTRTRSYHVTVVGGGRIETRYGFASYVAAQAAGDRIVADLPAEQPVSGTQRIVKLVPVGRAGR